jgi:hypothetical protein
MAACVHYSLRVLPAANNRSSQLTVQEISTMMRLGLKPIIFVINNDGYTIERCIHGENRRVELQPVGSLILISTQEIQQYLQLVLDSASQGLRR